MLKVSRRLAVWLLVIMALTIPVPSQQQSAPRISVGPNVHVSRSNGDRDHTEILVAADPEDADRLLVCTMIWSGEQNRLSSGVYASFDRGKMWTLTSEDRSTQMVWDPACIYGVNGTALFVTLPGGETSGDGKRTFPIYRSGDAGRTWTQTTRLPFIDREYLAVDRSGGAYHGRIYLYGTGTGLPQATGPVAVRNLHLFYSRDGGVTFTGPIAPSLPDKMSGSPSVGGLHSGAGVVLDDGTLLAPYTIFRVRNDAPRDVTYRPSQALSVVASRDGGQTLEPPTAVTQFGSGGALCRDMAPSVMAVDRSQGPFHGRAYLVWGEIRNGRCAALMTYSTNHGKTWSPPSTVDDAVRRSSGKGPDVLLPGLAVNRDGVVGVAWYDRREDPENQRHRMRFTASLDGGDTFLPSMPVSEAAYSFESPERYPVSPLVFGGGGRPAPPSYGGGAGQRTSPEFSTTVITAPRLYESVGDTGGMAADANGVFHVFWTDNRTGLAQLYTSAVTVAGKPLRNGATELTELENVTERLELKYIKSVYDPKARTITLHARLLNTSKEAVATPIKLRATTLTSDLGSPRATNADNGLPGAGAIWDLSSAVPRGRLEPGQATEPKALVFEIQGLRELGGRTRIRESFDPRAQFIAFDAKVYGRLAPSQIRGAAR